MAQVITTTYRSFSIGCQQKAAGLMPSVKRVQKRLISGVGVVFYYYDRSGQLLGNVSFTNNGARIQVN